jgi:anti-sigma factor RsiW
VSDHKDLEQDLVELALGEVAEPRRSELLSHLTGCLHCRAVYSEIVGAVDATVPAAPEAQPPAGFDARVLAALGIGGAATSTGRHSRLGRYGWSARSTSSRLLLAAAAVVLAAAGGFAGASVLSGDDADEPAVAQPAPLAANTTVLETGDGERVGTTAVAWMHERRVLVVSVHDAPVGVPYNCRVRLAEGQAKVLGRWTASSEDGGTWVMPAPQGQLTALELVLDSGKVWSTARLP